MYPKFKKDYSAIEYKLILKILTYFFNDFFPYKSYFSIYSIFWLIQK